MTQPNVTANALLAMFGQHAGTMPAINPPEAEKVLETQTAPEVAGEPEPEVVVPPVPAPVAKPADVVAAEAVKPARRTAAVVQRELDAALAEIAELKANPQSGDAELAAELKDAQEMYEQSHKANRQALELVQKLNAEIAEMKANDPDFTVEGACNFLSQHGFKVELEYRK